MNTYYKETDEQITDFSRVNIEHILPQNPHKSWGLTKNDIKPYVNRLGNLTLLSKRINSQIQNRLVVDKIESYKKSSLPITKKLVENLLDVGCKWNSVEIEKRHMNIANIALTEIWKL